jgi:hypothetical protein
VEHFKILLGSEMVSPPPQGSPTNSRRTRIALLACSVFESEIAMRIADHPNVVVQQQYEIGLHDHPETLRKTLQEAIDAMDSRDDIDAIALLYGLCGCGTAGLLARHHRLVIPRAHDCITVFMGSKEKYGAHQRSCPSCYYYTPGWNRSRRVPGPEKLEAMKEELNQRFDPEDVEFLLESECDQWKLHDTATYLDLGTSDAQAEAEYAAACAKWLGWKFEHLPGDPRLLEDLLAGNWNDAERFQIIEPGEQLQHSPDEKIMRAER